MTTAARVIKDFFGEYRQANCDHRIQSREPFFRPAKVIASGVSYNAYTRDLSAGGIGLVHDEAIATGPAEIEIELHSGEMVRVEVMLLWCHCQGSRFLSGALFLEELPNVDGRFAWPT